MLKNKTIEEFIEVLASDAPAPGGGSVAALCGALSSALLKMVCGLTIGRTKYAEFEEYAKITAEKAAILKKELTALIDEDTEAYNRVSAVLSMPKETAEQKSERSAAMQSALKYAAEVPLKTMKKSAECLELIKSSIGKTNQSAASDIGVAALCIQACAKGAWLNVKINLSSIKDGEFTQNCKEIAAGILDSVEKSATEIYVMIENAI